MVWVIVSLAALLVIPGAAVVRASGVHTPWALTLGPAVTFGIAGTAGWALDAIDVRFTSVSVSICRAVTLLLALCWSGGSALIRRRRGSVDRSVSTEAQSLTASRWHELSYRLIAGIGVIIAAAVLTWTAIGRIALTSEGTATIQQGWDTLWHASMLRSITEDGTASATRMDEIQNVETRSVFYYSAAWHAFGALWVLVVRLPITEAVNYLGIIIPAVTIPTAATALAWRITDRQKLSTAVAAGVAALASAALPVLIPVGVFVGAWSYRVSIVLAITVFAFVTPLPYAPQHILSAAFAIIGIGEFHPASVPTVVILGVIWWLCYHLPRPAYPELGAMRAKLYDIAVIAAAFVPAVAILLPQWLTGTSQTEDVRTVSAEVDDLNRFDAQCRGATMLTRHTKEFRPFWSIIILGFIGMAVLVFAGASRRRVWIVPAWFVSVLMTIHVLNHFGDVPGDILALYTDLHYSTPHRLVMVTAYLYSAFAGIAVVWGCAWTARISESRVPSTGRVLGSSLATVSSAVLVVYGVASSASAADSAYESPREWQIISNVDLKAFDWLAEQPEAYKHRTFTNPPEGSNWMYVRNDLSVMFPHYDWPVANEWTVTSVLHWHTNYLGFPDPDRPDGVNNVDRLAWKPGVGFIYLPPPGIWGSKEDLEFPGEGLWIVPGVTPVYRDKEVTIFAFSDMIMPERIDEMRASSPEVIPPSAIRGWSDGRVG